MEVKTVNQSDLDIIRELNSSQKDFKLASLDGLIIDRIVYDSGVPIAYGIVKTMAEAIMLANPSAPILLRAEAMRELMQYAEYGTKRFGCSQLHCFVSDKDLADSLVKHFGFIISKDIVLVKNI